MDQAELVDLLNKAVVASPAAPRNDSLADWANIDAATIAPFIDGMKKHPALQALWGKWVITPGWGMRIDAETAGIYLVDRARSGVPASIIILDLLQLVERNEVVVTTVKVVSHVKVNQPVDLGHGAKLLPAETLPPSYQRQAAFGLRANSATDRPEENASCALVIDMIVPFASPALEAQPGMPVPIAFNPEMHRTLNNAITAAEAALIVGAGAAPILGAQYSFVAAPGWPGMSGNGVGGSWPVEREPTLVTPASSPVLIPLSSRLQALHPTISLVVRRLHQLRTRNDTVEKAIDLGSCFEILLMHNEEGGNTEITNKIAHRGAWLLGVNFAERKTIAATIKGIYTLRSKAIHTGKLPDARDMDAFTKRAALLGDGENLIVRLIERLIGGWPAWADLTLGKEATETDVA